MTDSTGDPELLQEFLTEAGELLAEVDNMLVDLERRRDDPALLNHVFRGFHTIKGGAGFLGVQPLVDLCHLTESVFDRLRGGSLTLDAALMDVILAATASVRDMFDAMAMAGEPEAADAALVEALSAALTGGINAANPGAPPPPAAAEDGIDWAALHAALTGCAPAAAAPDETAVPAPQTAAARSPGRRAIDQTGAGAQRAGRRNGDRWVMRDNTIRIDTARMDQVLNLSSEIGLTRNRLACLRDQIIRGEASGETLRALDAAVRQLDQLVGDLQGAVMKTRMQPIGRLFQRYPRMARDLARQLGKTVELEFAGEDTEIDRTMVEELSDPLMHLVRNAVDHGIEAPLARRLAGKPEQGRIRLTARQAGNQIEIEIGDDGCGMRPDVLRRKALEKGFLDAQAAAALDDQQALHLIFMPGFSTRDEVSMVSGRGVGMDVVKSSIQRLNGRIDLSAEPGVGTRISIALPLTVAILPVLMVRVGAQPFAVPLSLVREIIPIRPQDVQSVAGRCSLLVRDEVLQVRTLSALIGWPQPQAPSCGVLVRTARSSLVLAVDGYSGREDVVIKPIEQSSPRGVAGATLAGDGSVVLVLDLDALLAEPAAADTLAVFEHAD